MFVVAEAYTASSPLSIKNKGEMSPVMITRTPGTQIALTGMLFMAQTAE